MRKPLVFFRSETKREVFSSIPTKEKWMKKSNRNPLWALANRRGIKIDLELYGQEKNFHPSWSNFVFLLWSWLHCLTALGLNSSFDPRYVTVTFPSYWSQDGFYSSRGACLSGGVFSLFNCSRYTVRVRMEYCIFHKTLTPFSLCQFSSFQGPDTNVEGET